MNEDKYTNVLFYNKYKHMHLFLGCKSASLVIYSLLTNDESPATHRWRHPSAKDGDAKPVEHKLLNLQLYCNELIVYKAIWDAQLLDKQDYDREYCI